MRSLTLWLSQHLQAMLSTLGKLLQQLWHTLFTSLVLGAILTLPCLLLYSLERLDSLQATGAEQPTLTLFLKDNVEEAQAKDWQQQLQQLPAIAQVTFEHREQALRGFQDAVLIQDFASITGSHPLPHLLFITPAANLPDLAKLQKTLHDNPLTDTVMLNQSWLQQLDTVFVLTKRITLTLSGFLALVVMLAIGNSVRVEIENRRAEIAVLTLLGATADFIQRPLLYLGAWLGLAAGVLASLLTALLVLLLHPVITEVLQQFHLPLAWLSVQAGSILLLFAATTLLGLLGAWITVLLHASRMDIAD